MVKAGQVDEVAKRLKFNATKQLIPNSRFTTEERRTLDAIGTALKKRLIDFHIAAEFSDMVKTGRVGDVLKWLESDPTNKPDQPKSRTTFFDQGITPEDERKIHYTVEEILTGSYP